MSALRQRPSAPLATVRLTYRGRYANSEPLREIECEVYAKGAGLAVHTICPRCANALWIDSARKAIRFDPKTNELHVEPFTCTWELGPERHHFGVGLCRARIAYEGRVARDA